MATTTHPPAQQTLPGTTEHAAPKAPPPGPSKFHDHHALAPGELPHMTDTEPPALHPATVIGDGVVSIDEKKLKASQHEHHNQPAKPTHA